MNRPTLSTPLTKPVRVFWNTARVTALVVTAAVLVGLFVRPDLTLRIAWFGIVPVLPASFLVNAGLWRSVCPIATANVLTGDPVGKRPLNGRWAGAAAVIGILLLVLLVPMRRLVLNQNGPALAGLLVAIVAAAFVLGTRFNMKSGFCNAICPILPVEKLYGQSPLVYVRNPRCVPCSVCTRKGCYDLDPRSALTSSAKAASGKHWVLSAQGLFVTAFPGLVFGYFQTSDAPFSEWASVYAAALTPALVSMLVLGAAAFMFRVRRRLAVPALGALAVGIYYWYAGPASADAFGLSTETGLELRWMFIAFVTIWLVLALRRSMSRPGSGRPARTRPVDPAVLPNIH
jgi:hypothetical protein